MSKTALKVVKRILVADGLFLSLAILILASPAAAQGLAELLSASRSVADQAASVAVSTDGVLRLALWAVILLVFLLGAVIAYLLKWVSKVSACLDRLSSRPCLVTQEGLEDYMRREHAMRLNT